MDAVFVWDGAEWEQEPRPDLALLITRAAKEFGWTVPQILEMTPGALMAMLKNSRRVNLEDALFSAMAFHDPERIISDLEDLQDADLTDKERWVRGIKKIRSAMKH